MTNENTQIVGIPFWILFSILLPGFVFILLYTSILEKMGINLFGWTTASQIEKVVLGIFFGFLFYTLPLAYYIKKYIPFYKNTIKPLHELITKKQIVDFTLNFNNRKTTINDAYVFHNEFIVRLKENNIPVQNRDYGYFIFAIFVAVILASYIIFRIIVAYVFIKLCIVPKELIEIIFYLLLSIYLFKDSRDSLKKYFRNLCRLVLVHEKIAKDTIEYIKNKGTDFIRPSPGIDYP